ncbi:MAG: alpha/beta hydrolase [Alphaproteobacteria bacterium]|nr:MAG: alpha/beta hydrolase [Alphaproteobacteria bacterium]
MSTDLTPPDLETRFQEPEGWRWHSFKHNGRTLRFGTSFPKDSVPDAVVVCLQGVREFSEKYFEVARWCNANNITFWTFDWAGQGKSTRYLSNPQKRHGEDFAQDVEDLHCFIMEYIKHSSVHTDKGRIPMAMLAHSMGANLGMRYLQKYPDTFECAAFSAPMIGLKVFEKIPQSLAQIATSLCGMAVGHSYIPGGDDWGKQKKHARLSSDPVRTLVHNQWCDADPALQCGEVTFGWLNEAQKSCRIVQHPSFHTQIDTPCLFGIPGNDDLVANTVAKKVIDGMKNAQAIDYSESFHEILMETDNIREDFLNKFYDLIKENIIDRPETLKPF